MSADLSRAYELLGVKPGFSTTELKAAHRDLAKVWHPDRFLHDPRLQEKAQEKLKEINEAYELLVSGKTPRSVPPPSAQTVRTPAKNSPAPRRVSNWQWAAVPLLIFAAVFAVTTRALLQRGSQQFLQQDVPAAQLDQEAPPQTNSNTRAASSNTSRSVADSTAEVTSSETVVSAPPAAVATVTVTIDPESGLLAKPDCPLRSRMTYPGGSEPNAYCNISHTPPPKDSRIKSFAKSVRSLN